jgi:8-oxo-dGTP pyrophosphatase MutT (NUDIX family)
MLDELSVTAALPTGMQREAVLASMAAYPGEVRLILTERTMALRVHSGQIALPGGKIEARDKSPAAAATATLHEGQEEIGLDAGHAEPLRFLDPDRSGSGFSIVPVAAEAAAPVAFKINPDKAIEAFEAPFALLINAATHAPRHEGAQSTLGVTTGILPNLHERLYS